MFVCKGAVFNTRMRGAGKRYGIIMFVKMSKYKLTVPESKRGDVFGPSFHLFIHRSQTVQSHLSSNSIIVQFYPFPDKTISLRCFLMHFVYKCGQPFGNMPILVAKVYRMNVGTRPKI